MTDATDVKPVCPREAELEDMRFCPFCTYAATGYEFAAVSNGLDPGVCPRCTRYGFLGWAEQGFKKGSDVFAVKRPGRNDPCPCGDGGKYKKCCLKIMPWKG